MKNEAIGRLLKQSGRSTVFYQYDENGEVLRQYISNGYAVYPVDERMPILDEAAIRLFFRLPEDEDKLVIHERTMPESLDFEDLSAEPCERLGADGAGLELREVEDLDSGKGAVSHNDVLLSCAGWAARHCRRRAAPLKGCVMRYVLTSRRWG